MTAKYNRVSVFGTYINGLKLLARGSAEGRLELQRAGLLINTSLTAMRRYQVDSLGASFTAKMANTLLTVSGLNRWTDGWRAAYAMMHARTLAELVERGPVVGRDLELLREKGVTDTDLALWKLARGENTHFGRLLTPDAIFRIPDAALSGAAGGPPPVPSGMTRMYHGGLTQAQNAPTWFSSHRPYAESYAESSGTNSLLYVDIPTGHPLIAPDPTLADQTIARGFHRNVELPADIARTALPLVDRRAGIELPVAAVTTTAQQLRREAATKLLSVLITESRMAVVEPGMLQRAQMSLQAPRGDIKGELLRSFWQFKSFPWSFFQKHIVQRGWNGQETAGGKIAYLGPTMIASTLLGAAALEINDMLLGKDPRPLYGADGQIVTKNWIAAAAKGGGLGVYGDFLAAESTSDASSALATLAGPLASTAAQGVNLLAGNAVQALGDKPTNFGREGVAFVKGVTPGANLWYTKAATDHWLFNYLQEQLSPGYSARIEARARTQFGHDYWWRPRDLTPQGPFRPESLIAGR
jgi:hypothetical protein